MGNKSDFSFIRGIVIQQKEQTIITKNQVNRYKEALKKAKEKSMETEINGIKEDSKTIEEQFTQESYVKPTSNNLDNKHQNLSTQTKPSNENHHNTESLIGILKRKFRDFFSHTN
ncbi:hypothetical protein [Metabacillus idriensis]|uniref:hypothetical protein n=1 Tax=Metabacillus idriensis TaxID=324768 RepID=UPI00174A96EE|nr:hypothetical protein [Metabacillus idriensis]